LFLYLWYRHPNRGCTHALHSDIRCSVCCSPSVAV